MEDAVYDQLYRELQLETQYPVITADSLLSVGEKRLNFQYDTKSLYSLENAFNIEELQAWQQRWRLVTSGAQKVEYVRTEN